MDTNSALWIGIAVVAALIVIGLVVFATRKVTSRRRIAESDRIRAEVEQENQRVQRQAALVDEAEAKARAAQAEAEAKAAEAARLADTAAGRREALTSTRDGLAARREEADELDPRIKQDRKTSPDDDGQAVGEQQKSTETRRDVPTR
ncbi:hypothetical protein JDV09_20890 [Mycobacterium sp. Y57]|uniref:hypothetical protein n=1 Tax=Mycolicibacterium xanthum TaxID=2796469 RepID=UPI001C84DE88|nr:hypothetical protein [Mycolicibacterium xanthum]MBX7434537.1 hypothetical protein [Mycolicibacterium xanthum]